MAFFKLKKNKKEESENKKSVKKEGLNEQTPLSFHRRRNILKAPRITEKASMLSGNRNVYTFNIEARATKKDVEKAVFDIYKVRPSKVRIAKVQSKRTFVRGKKGVKSGGKKAYIYLKAGDKIEIA